MSGVRYWDYLDEYLHNRDEVLALVDEVFSSGRLILGSKVSAFEEKFSAMCGARFGVGVNSGTDALFLAFKALGVGPGAEVITVANTAVPTVAAIRAAGATPVFVDVEADSFLMDVSQLERVITANTGCIVPVHLYGQAVDMASLLDISHNRQIPVIEDCAQAAGATYQGRTVGSFGAIGAFSFYPTKVIGAFGDGGMAVTSSPELQQRLRRLRFYGMDSGYYSEEEGYNSRLDEVQAALLLKQLAGLAASVGKRQKLAQLYHDGLQGIEQIIVPAVKPDNRHQWYVYTIRAQRRDELMQYLSAQGIETRLNYPVPIHLMRGYRFLGYQEGSLPVTEKLSGEIISLPMYPGLPASHVEQVVNAISRFFRA